MVDTRTVIFIGPEELSTTQSNLIRQILEGAGYSPTFHNVIASPEFPDRTILNQFDVKRIQDLEPGELDGGEPDDVAFFTVALYHMNLAFGGHEEGGWWYNTGDPISDPVADVPELPFEFAMPRYFLTRKEAYTYCNALQDVIDDRIKQPRFQPATPAIGCRLRSATASLTTSRR